jgi:hypothetical protein
MGIFAQVLQEILRERQGADYSHLGGSSPRTDPVWYPLRRMAIAPEVINRLKAAATSDSRRATLNPDDLDYLSDQLGFSIEETRRLRAALLAQGVEIFLHDRLSEAEGDTTIEIAHQVYEQLLASFRVSYDKVRGDGDSVTPLDRALALADRAASMAHAASCAAEKGAPDMQRFWLHAAAAGYEEVISRLSHIEPQLADDFSAPLKRAQEALEALTAC